MTTETTTPEPECSTCQHKQSNYICGCKESPFYKQTVEPDHSCDHFKHNPGQDHKTKGLKLSLANEPEPAIAEFRKALEYDLPQDDRMATLSFLSGQYIQLMRHRGDIDENCEEFSSALETMEAAAKIDSEEQFGYFFEIVNRARLRDYDHLVSIMADHIRHHKGLKKAISFLKKKIDIFDYLPTNPLISSLHDLGYMYVEKNNPVLAAGWFRKVLEADVVDPGDESGSEQELKSMARNNYRLAKDAASKCFVATAALGSPFSTELGILRSYRDKVLSRSSAGRAFISIYYRIGPHLASPIRKSGHAQTITTRFLVKPLTAIAATQLQRLEQGEEDGKKN